MDMTPYKIDYKTVFNPFWTDLDMSKQLIFEMKKSLFAYYNPYFKSRSWLDHGLTNIKCLSESVQRVWKWIEEVDDLRRS